MNKNNVSDGRRGCPPIPYRILALFGKSGSGKDTIQNYIIDNTLNTNKVIHYTTRPQRDYEKHGFDYYFVSDGNFARQEVEHQMLYETKFNSWWYGISIESLSLEKINIGVFSIDAIKSLSADARINILPVLIDAPPTLRIERQLTREECPDCTEICRRFLSDEEDFKQIPFDYLTFSNNQNNIDNCSTILNIPIIREFLSLDNNI